MNPTSLFKRSRLKLFRQASSRERDEDLLLLRRDAVAAPERAQEGGRVDGGKPGEMTKSHLNYEGGRISTTDLIVLTG